PPTSHTFPYTTLFRSYLAPELALVVKCGVVSFRLGHERDALSSKRKLHWDPDIVEDHIFRQTFKVGAPDHCDGAGHADHTAETRSEEHTSELQSRFDL